MRIRIKATPLEREVDGVKLGVLTPGSVRDVSSILGFWLIAQGYAQSEMRVTTRRQSNRAAEAAVGHNYKRRRADRRRTRS